ncbi:MAG: hypothetical protein ACRDD1_16345, partial [Planctomycetia bacterium]
RAGFMAAVMVAVHPTVVQVTQIARMYTLSMLLLLVVVDAVQRGEAHAQRLADDGLTPDERASETKSLARDAWIVAAATALLLVTHYAAYMAYAAVVVYLAVGGNRTRRLLYGAACGFALVAPWLAVQTYVDFVLRSRGVGWHIADAGGFAPAHLFSLMHRLHAVAGSGWGANAAGAAAVAAGLCLVAKRGRPAWLLAAVWLGPPAVAALLGLAGFPSVASRPRYFTASTIAGAAILAAAVVGLPNVSRLGPWLRRGLAVGLVTVAAVAAVGELSTVRQPLRDAAAVLRGEIDADERLIVVGNELTQYEFDYYLPGAFTFLPMESAPEAFPDAAAYQEYVTAKAARAAAATDDGGEVAGVWVFIDWKRYTPAAGREKHVLDPKRLVARIQADFALRADGFAAVPTERKVNGLALLHFRR